MNFRYIVVCLAVLWATTESLDVTCGVDSVDITVTAADQTQLSYASFPGTTLAINTARITAGDFGTHTPACIMANALFALSFGRTLCNPVINQVGDTITHTWRLWKVIPDADFGVAARYAEAYIEFSCNYEATATVFASFQPTIGVSQFATTALGQFAFSFDLYSDSPGGTSVGSTPVEIPDRIYGRISLDVTTLGDLTAQVKTCFASESSDPSANPAHGAYEFITAFCAEKGEASDPAGVAAITMQGEGQNAEFNFMSFAYADTRDGPVPVYIHCTARACDTASEACTKDAACKTVAKRSINDEDDRNTQTLTYGPIIMKPKQRTCDLDNGGCDEICTMHGNGAVCSCGIGRSLADNARSCVDEIRVDLAVEQHENMLYVDATKVVGLMVLLLAAIFATVLITMSCRRSDKGKNVFQAV